MAKQGPRAMWKGAVTFGLVTVPVALHPATERKNELSFRLLHAKDESPVDYKRVCHEEGVEVPWSEIVKGYALAKDHYVVVTDEDFEKARVPATQTFEIRDFVTATAIDDFYFTQPYYVVPASTAAAKPYALLRDALEKSGRVGVGTIVLRQREHLAALEPAGEALVLTTLRWAYEIRSASSLGLPARPTTPAWPGIPAAWCCCRSAPSSSTAPTCRCSWTGSAPKSSRVEWRRISAAAASGRSCCPACRTAPARSRAASPAPSRSPAAPSSPSPRKSSTPSRRRASGASCSPTTRPTRPTSRPWRASSGARSCGAGFGCCSRDSRPRRGRSAR